MQDILDEAWNAIEKKEPNRKRVFLIFTLLLFTSVLIVLFLHSFFGVKLFPVFHSLLGKAITGAEFLLYFWFFRAMFPTQNSIYNLVLSMVLLVFSLVFSFFLMGFFFGLNTNGYTRIFLFWLLSTLVQLLSTGAIIKGFIYLKVKFFTKK